MPTNQEELLKELIALAKVRAREDDKHYARRDDLRALLRAGAQVLSNGPGASGTYVCKVKYQGFVFVHVDWTPIRIHI